MTTKKRKHVRIPRDFTRLDIMHPVAAGIDIGSSSHFVAVSPHLCEESVREFGALTPDLVSLVGWFKGLGIQSVVMESTGIYWVPLYEMLEAEGIDVQLVNAHHVRSVPGRKSDVLDCQWLLKLHTFGLLRGSFRPTAEIVTLRTYLRQRDSLVVRSGVEVQHMHKALNLMNIKLSTVLSDITGKTGLNIIRAIVAGQRDPAVLASMRDGRCKACEQTLLDSLTGNYVPEHLFALRQALRLYDMLQALIEECDQESTKLLSELTESLPTPAPIPKAKKRGHKQPQVDYRTPATQLLNVDLTAIPGISEYTAITLMSEIGTDGQEVLRVVATGPGHQNHRWQGLELPHTANHQPRCRVAAHRCRQRRQDPHSHRSLLPAHDPASRQRPRSRCHRTQNRANHLPPHLYRAALPGTWPGCLRRAAA
jgi:hypothetical protein